MVEDDSSMGGAVDVAEDVATAIMATGATMLGLTIGIRAGADITLTAMEPVPRVAIRMVANEQPVKPTLLVVAIGMLAQIMQPAAPQLGAAPQGPPPTPSRVAKALIAMAKVDAMGQCLDVVRIMMLHERHIPLQLFLFE